MTLRWFAESLDRAFIRLFIRRTLPEIRQEASLSRLRLAEARTASGLKDEELFPEQSIADLRISRSRLLADGRRELTRRWSAPRVPVESSWFAAIRRELSVSAKWYVRENPRPLLVCVGGWQPMPVPPLFWPMRALDRIGFDVVVPMLTIHATWPIAETNRPRFPGPDPLRNIVELARAAISIRQVLAQAREFGHPSVSIWGTSLGAHAVALAATIPSSTVADRFVLEKPVAKMSDALRLHGPGLGSLRDAVALRLDRVYSVASPLDRRPCTCGTEVHVIGAEFDRVTPISGALSMANHFGAVLHTIEASHLFDRGRLECMIQILNPRAARVRAR